MEESTQQQPKTLITEVKEAVEDAAEKIEGVVEGAVEKAEEVFGGGTDAEPEADEAEEATPEPEADEAEEATPGEEPGAEPDAVAVAEPEVEPTGATAWNANSDGAGQYEPKPGEAKTPPGIV